MAGKSPLDIKPESKAEMVEWLALKLLKWEPSAWGHNKEFKGWQEPEGRYFANLENFLYSPDGFFEVKVKMFEKGYQLYKSYPIWDEAGEGLEVALSEDHTKATIFKGQYYYPKEKELNNIEAEIEAFYGAVYEAMKEDQ